MSFDTGAITEVFPPSWEGGRLVLSWAASVGPPDHAFHVYVEGKKAWAGRERKARIKAPSGMIDVQIGAVLASELDADFSSTLFPILTRAKLTWDGGAWQAEDIAGFHVYQGDEPDAAVNYTRSVGTVAAIEQGLSTDGFGLGGFGDGGFGAQGGRYSWTSGPLARGSWNFGVVPYDSVGNDGTGAETSVAIKCPPRPPAIDVNGRRLEYTYNLAAKKVTLTWLASPDA